MWKSLIRSASKLRPFARPILLRTQPILKQRLLVCGLGFTTMMITKNVLMKNEYVQSTVYSDTHPNCVMLVLEVKENNKEVLNTLKYVPNLTTKQEEDQDLPSLMVGVGFSTQLWEKLSYSKLKHFEAKVGEHGIMPKSEGNVVIHIKGETYSHCFETVKQILSSLPQDSYRVVQENYGFKYKDGRDLSGFIDGTMNPVGEQQRESVSVTENGGSYMIHQIWRHDLDLVKNTSKKELEKWIGRSQDYSVEQKEKDIQSHVARTRDAGNNRILIVRQSMPFGKVYGDHGLLFIAYSNTVDKFDLMLDRMTGKKDGLNDHIMKLSKCVFSNYYYIPSMKELEKL